LLTLDQAVTYALEHNPELAARRQQHGIAAAAVVIARTYPHNPTVESKVFGDGGPASAGITNRVVVQDKVILEVEVAGQRHFRIRAAQAGLTRTDWEIASQEVATAVNLIRAFNGVLYRREKLQVTEEFVQLNQQALEQTRRLVQSGVLRPADLLVAQTELADVRSQVGLGRTVLATTRRDFYRVLGAADWCIEPQGSLERPVPCLSLDELIASALEQRPDLQGRRAAVAEVEAQLRLAVADRFGNPSVGPVYENNETSVNFIGIQVGFPIPVFNRRQGEIQQKQAQRDQAIVEVQRSELEIRQEVQAAVVHMTEARAWADSYRTETLPTLRQTLDDMQRLFLQGQPGVDVLRLVDIRRKLLRARDGYLDAQWEYTQALADLAAALGDPGLALCPPQIPASNP
jgi:cobalt-zinc-cadmium efflux system outer membrane protein